MIDVSAFHRIAKTFADADYEIRHDSVTFAVRDELIDIRLRISSAQLFVIENDATIPAVKWLATRLGRLPVLAERIVQYSPHDLRFIPPSGRAVLCPEHPNFQDDEVPTADACATLKSLLDWEPAGTSSVIYLTSDGGEGKTTVTNRLACKQAEDYQRGHEHWLLVPVELGGRPFLRLDEIATGALLNKYRFSYLYYDSLIEFCKLGLIVLAIDGFEEMFVDDPAGDATSSVGRLLDSLDSNGRVLISARRAFFEFHNLADQTKLFDSVRGKSVAFSRVSLDRWSTTQFVSYCELCKIERPSELYDSVVDALGDARHPLLTRPVLVKQLAEAAVEPQLRADLVSTLEQAPSEYLKTVIEAIVIREVTLKWIDRSGGIATPLLSLQEHLKLLADVAVEMWRSGGQIVRIDTLGLIVELFLEQSKHSAAARHQVQKWAPQHALLAKKGERFLEFDHEEIFAYFLGCGLGAEICSSSEEALRSLLRTSAISSTTASMISGMITDRQSVIDRLKAIARRETPSSMCMDNIGLLLARLLADRVFDPALLIENITFPSSALSLRGLSGIRFKGCALGVVAAGTWRDVVFSDCMFEEIRVSGVSRFDKCSIDDKTRIHAIRIPPNDVTLYAPESVRANLSRLGITTGVEPAAKAPEADEEFILAEKCIMLFTRSTELNEQSLRKRLGSRAPRFFNDVLPRLLQSKIMSATQYHGAGQQERYILARPLHEIAAAMKRSEGRFNEFLNELDH
jgi:hypothetical protein